MRRLAILVVLAAASLVPLTGCVGVEGKQAQDILAQTDEAMAQAESFRFAGRLTLETSVGDFGLVMRGAASKEDGGASVVTVSSDDVPGFPEVTVVTRGQDAWMKAGGSWQHVQVPAGQATGMDQFDFVPYIKDVDVDGGQQVGGEPAVKITGVLDTAGLVNGFLGQLGTVPGGALPDISDGLGDTRVVLYVSETSHLPLRTLVDMSFEQAGESVEMHFDFAITNVDEPVAIPHPGG
jgi:hypothetical protein